MRLRLFAPLTLALLAGCGGDGDAGGTVSGTVTYDGRPVADGYVQFTPKDGKGSVVGASITGGKYRATKVPPGPATVFVSSSAGPAAGSGPVSTGDLAKAAKDRQKAPAPAADQIPADAAGNNATHDIKAGPNEINLDLKPKGK